MFLTGFQRFQLAKTWLKSYKEDMTLKDFITKVCKEKGLLEK